MTTKPTTPPSSDTPGRPKTSGSRQQTHPDQQAQTGAKDLDSRSTGEGEPDRADDVRTVK
jgi:hypothetical protein